MTRRATRAAASFVTIAAHEAEEAVFGPSLVADNSVWLREAVGDRPVELWTGPGFRPGLLAITVAAGVVAVVAARARERSPAIYLLLGTLALFTVNALVPHLAVALLLGRYNPGAVTAGALVLPVAVWVFTATLRDGSATPRGAAIATLAGIVVYVLFLSAVQGGRDTAGYRDRQMPTGSSAIREGEWARTCTRDWQRISSCRSSCLPGRLPSRIPGRCRAGGPSRLRTVGSRSISRPSAFRVSSTTSTTRLTVEAMPGVSRVSVRTFRGRSCIR